MACILNIETSGNICSIALSRDGVIEFQREDHEGMAHSRCLAPFVDECLSELDRKGEKLDAVAVSNGPGSYTGLRIGLSLAKGLCFAREIPLITVSTLQVLAVKAMFRSMEWEGDELIVPMIDARRMEVYTAVYDFSLAEVMAPRPLILDSAAYSELPSGRRLIFIGNGAGKARDLIDRADAVWYPDAEPLAADMMALTERAFRRGDFADTAYSIPEYLKEYQAVIGTNKVLEQACNHSEQIKK